MGSFSGGAFGGGEIVFSSVEAAAQSKYIGHGSVDVEFPDKWYHLDSNGNFVRDNNGHKMFLGFPGYPFLDSKGDPMIDTNTGDWIIQSNHQPHGLGGYKSPYLLDSRGKIMLDTQADE